MNEILETMTDENGTAWIKTAEDINVWECPCGAWEVMPADQQRWQMGQELVELGDTDEKFALYKCGTCGAESWSHVETVERWDESEDEQETKGEQHE